MEHITNEELLSLKIQEIIDNHSSIKDVKICKAKGKIAFEYEFNTKKLRKDLEKAIFEFLKENNINENK